MWRCELYKLRKEVDDIDRKIILLLVKRFSVTKKILKLKKENNMKIVDKEREKEIFRDLGKDAEKSGLNKRFIKDIFGRIIKEARKVYNESGRRKGKNSV